MQLKGYFFVLSPTYRMLISVHLKSNISVNLEAKTIFRMKKVSKLKTDLLKQTTIRTIQKHAQCACEIEISSLKPPLHVNKSARLFFWYFISCYCSYESKISVLNLPMIFSSCCHRNENQFI